MVAPRMIHPTSRGGDFVVFSAPVIVGPVIVGGATTPPPGRDGLRRRSLARLLGVLRVRPLPPPPRARARAPTDPTRPERSPDVRHPAPATIHRLPVAPRPTLPQRVDDAPRRGHGRVPLARRPVPARLARARDPRDPPGARPPVRPRRRSRGALRLQRLARRRPHRRAGGRARLARRRVVERRRRRSRAPGAGLVGTLPPPPPPPPSSSSAGRSISGSSPPGRFRRGPRAWRRRRGRRRCSTRRRRRGEWSSRPPSRTPGRCSTGASAGYSTRGDAPRAAVVSWWDEGVTRERWTMF